MAFYCKNCSKTITDNNHPQYVKGIRIKARFCSTSCYNSWMDRNVNNKTSGGSSSNSGSSSENDAELARIEWEKEQAEKRESAEKKAKREAKAKILKEQGKPFMAFVTINQEGVLIAITIGLFGVFFAFITGNDSGNYIAGIIASIVVATAMGFGIYKYLKEVFKK